jgi:formylglycine-generating enzyme required for sulfatase activity
VSDDLVGRKLGPYEITEFVGRENWLERYWGHHTKLDRPVAITVVGREMQPDPTFDETFRREASRAAKLRHPNIARVLDFGQIGGGHFVISVRVQGTGLATALGEMLSGHRRMEPDDISFIIRQIAAALSHAHSRGVIHQMITPGSIWLTRSGQAILADFGLGSLCKRGADIGAPEYMAPEQIAAGPSVPPISPATDIYALGVILYEMTTGERPFEADNPIDAALRSLNETAPDPRYLNPTMPIAVAQVILKAMSRDPARRYADAMEMATALERAWKIDDEVLVAQAAAATRTGRPALPAETSSAPPTAVRRSETPPEPRRRALPQIGARPTARRYRPSVPARRRLTRLAMVLAAILLIWVAGLLVMRTFGMLGWLTAALSGSPVEAALSGPTPRPTATPTSTPTPTDTPTPTQTLTPTPLSQAQATPLPPVDFVSLGAGTRALRLHDGMTLRFVPAGPFLMGSDDPDREPDERPQHTVTLSDYWIDETEVTNAQYRLCVEAGACPPPVAGTQLSNPNYADYPAVYVRFEGAEAYCAWLAESSGLPVSLPSEAQWEKAASWDEAAGVKRTYPWGEQEPNPDLLRYVESVNPRPGAPVGSYPAGASPYGALDMAGNVWEWVADRYDPAYYNSLADAQSDPTGPGTGSTRVIRGGGWSWPGRFAVTTLRSAANPANYTDDLGFRCALTGQRPPADSGIVLTKAEAVGGLIEQIEAAQPAGTSDDTSQEWLSALEKFQVMLPGGNSEAILAFIEERATLADEQSQARVLDSGLALRIRRTLEWIRAQAEG